MDKVYLGDSVYMELNSAGQLILTTDNGDPVAPSNRIVLEAEVFDNLVQTGNKMLEDMHPFTSRAF